MTSGLRKGIAIALVHVAIVTSVGAKLLVDRARLPRVWVRADPFESEQDLRGRYYHLRIEVTPGPGLPLPPPVDAPRVEARPTARPVSLEVKGDALVATPSPRRDLSVSELIVEGRLVLVLDEPQAFYMPEHVASPFRRAPGEELWVEVSVPRRGPPRPIQLGVKKNGVLTPLAVR